MVCAQGAAVAPAASKPNILVIVADDQWNHENIAAIFESPKEQGDQARDSLNHESHESYE